MATVINALAHDAKAPVAIQCENFSFSYPRAEKPVLNSVNLAVKPGEFLVLTGKTGSGKSTFLRCLKPELAPVGKRSGTLEVQGGVGFAQNPETQIVCDTAWHEMAFGLENAGIPADEMRQRIAEVAYFFNMEPWFNAPVSQLSGGQKQLLNLAAVLALRPQVLLLDEPTSQLDPLAQRDFIHALFRINKELGLTVVVATHAPELFKAYASRQVSLVEGQIVEGELEAPDTKPHGADTDAVATAVPSVVAGQSLSPVLALKNVHAAYGRQSASVLRGVTFQVLPGEIHALIGGNGSGKSTALRVVAGIMNAYRGKVVNRSRAQTFLPQDPHALFLADTLQEELELWQTGAGYLKEDIEALCAKLELSSCMHLHPYDLSGGQQQLAALAKLALTKPDLYLLDEPLKGLDRHARNLAIKLLQEEALRGAAILVATHDMAFVREYCHQVSFLFNGEIATTDVPKDFFAQNIFFAPFVANQGGGV